MDRKVFVVDDDEGGRKSLECLLSVHGLNTQVFESAEQFLSYATQQPVGCIVTDLNMPNMSGLELFERTRAAGWTIPTIIITAFGEVSSCASAFKQGIVDYIEKPVPAERLIALINKCLDASQRDYEQSIGLQDAQNKLQLLTTKEREVLDMLVRGLSMKAIAAEFGTSFQAVSRHRQRILEKIGVEGDVSLARWMLDYRRLEAAKAPAEVS